MGDRPFSFIETQETSSGAHQEMSNQPPPLILPLTTESLDVLDSPHTRRNGFIGSMHSSIDAMMQFETSYDNMIHNLFINITHQQKMDSINFLFGYYIPQRCEYNIRKLNDMMSYPNYSYDKDNHILTSLITGLPVELCYGFVKELEDAMHMIEADARIVLIQYPNKYDQLFSIVRELQCRLGYFQKLYNQRECKSVYEAMSDGYFVRKHSLRRTAENLRANLHLPDVLTTIRVEGRFDKFWRELPEISNDLLHFFETFQDVVELDNAQAISLSNDLKNHFNEVWNSWHITKNYLMRTRKFFDLKAANEQRFQQRRPSLRTELAYEKESDRFSSAIIGVLEQGEAPAEPMLLPNTNEFYPFHSG